MKKDPLASKDDNYLSKILNRDFGKNESDRFENNSDKKTSLNDEKINTGSNIVNNNLEESNTEDDIKISEDDIKNIKQRYNDIKKFNKKAKGTFALRLYPMLWVVVAAFMTILITNIIIFSNSLNVIISRSFTHLKLIPNLILALNTVLLFTGLFINIKKSRTNLILIILMILINSFVLFYINISFMNFYINISKLKITTIIFSIFASSLIFLSVFRDPIKYMFRGNKKYRYNFSIPLLALFSLSILSVFSFFYSQRTQVKFAVSFLEENNIIHDETYLSSNKLNNIRKKLIWASKYLLVYKPEESKKIQNNVVKIFFDELDSLKKLSKLPDYPSSFKLRNSEMSYNSGIEEIIEKGKYFKKLHEATWPFLTNLDEATISKIKYKVKKLLKSPFTIAEAILINDFFELEVVKPRERKLSFIIERLADKSFILEKDSGSFISSNLFDIDFYESEIKTEYDESNNYNSLFNENINWQSLYLYLRFPGFYEKNTDPIALIRRVPSSEPNEKPHEGWVFFTNPDNEELFIHKAKRFVASSAFPARPSNNSIEILGTKIKNIKNSFNLSVARKTLKNSTRVIVIRIQSIR